VRFAFSEARTQQPNRSVESLGRGLPCELGMLVNPREKTDLRIAICKTE
jgi:hypothetical protein